MRLHVSRLLLPLIVLAVASSVLADPASTETGIAKMKEDIFYLAGPECEGRGIETKGINKAADYIAGQFKTIGLKPLGVEGGYFQPFPLRGSARVSGAVTLKLKGPKDQETDLKINSQFTLSGLTAKKKIAADLVFVGHGITVKDGYDDYKGLDVAGKIVVILRKTPRFENKDAPFTTSPEDYASFQSKAQNAEKHKVGGILFVNDKKSATPADDLLSFEMTRGEEGREIPALFVKRDIVDQLLVGSSKNLTDLESAIDKDLKPQSFALTGCSAEMDVNVDRPRFEAKNVIGLLEGSGPLSKEYIVIGAHYDHLGRGENGTLAKGSKEIHFGADDNASGTTGMIELARRLAGLKDRKGRSVVFMAFSGEERGLLGSSYFCNKAPLVPLKDIAAMINLDMIGRVTADEKSKQDKIEIGGTGTAKGFSELLDLLNKKYQFAIKKSSSGFGPSDHTSFYAAKIPVFFFFTGLHSDYHKPGDTPDKINLPGMLKVVTMVEELAVTLLTADRPQYLETKGGSMVGAPRGPRIGIIPGEYNEDETMGALVGGVSAGGPADKAGLKKGDWITAIGGKPVKNMTSYMTAMAGKKKGEVIEFVIRRGDKELKLSVTPE